MTWILSVSEHFLRALPLSPNLFSLVPKQRPMGNNPLRPFESAVIRTERATEIKLNTLYISNLFTINVVS